MSQGGLKHAATESRLDSKRERRRGAAGRAAVLRRAPSDSDCSGETASLSADSGDRAIRPIPAPTRSGKSRSRRRGSEWEVLEGLKDGQRFEKRPDVFNGYLHKKRKWPLKGWHKRYFVVDGGILVYARSPTDVARGRLHGSVDVGLSVISAKARRRRIDIDADEFIYHLRAKTPDVFRTWLNVLKAHRLYRQHLLTFGARESVPKIHAPLEDLPPTDTSTRSSSLDTMESTSTEELSKPEMSSTISSNLPSSCYPSNKTCDAKSFKDPNIDVNAKCKKEEVNSNPTHAKANGDNKSKDVLVADKCRADKTECNIPEFESCYVATKLRKRSRSNLDILRQIKDNTVEAKSSLYSNNKVEPTPAYFFFHRKKSFRENEFMRRSRKSTNLVKYKNILNEPKLKRPLSRCMLLGKYPNVRLSGNEDLDKTVECDTMPQEHNSVQVIMSGKEFASTSVQDTMTADEYSEIAENVLISIFESHNPQGTKCHADVRNYINKIVEELYEVKLHSTDDHPVKTLFRSLLEYWLRHSKQQLSRRVSKSAKSVGPESYCQFTVDKEISSVRLSIASRGTQYRTPTYRRVTNNSKLAGKPPKPIKKEIKPPKHSPRRDTESFEKERRVQELERILKNTIYVCDVQSFENKEKDVKITRTLLDNIGKLTKKIDNYTCSDEVNDSSSSEVPKIQETINHLISDTSMPPDVAKDFLNAYLGVLNDTSRSATENSTSASCDVGIKPADIDCDVQTEAVQRKLSKSIITDKLSEYKTDFAKDKNNVVDPGQQYLKDILDKVTTIFSKINIQRGRNTSDTKTKESKSEEDFVRSMKKYPAKNLIRTDYDTNSVVIDLSKYDLEHISMLNDPNVKDTMCITIKLKEKPHNHGEMQKTHLNLKFSNDALPAQHDSKPWVKVTSNSSTNLCENRKQNCKHSIFDFNTSPRKSDLKPYVSSCEISSKAYCRVVHESEHSIDLSFKSSRFYENAKRSDKNDDPQSCYIMSFQKKNLAMKTKKKVRLKECHGLILNSCTNMKARQKSSYPDKYSVFEKPTPKIIDEKFILLLLENLTLLSKDLPGLYKDIQSLFTKLKKKHEKGVKSCNNIQGLSLLGKIYNDDSIYKPTDVHTQASNSLKKISLSNIATNTSKQLHENTIEVNTSFHKNIINKNVVSTNTSSHMNDDVIASEVIMKVISTNTSSSLQKNSIGTKTSNINNKNVKSTSTSDMRAINEKGDKHSFRNISKDLEMLTEAYAFEVTPKNKIFDDQSSSVTIRSSKELATAEQAISGQNWPKKAITEDCAVSTVIKCVLNKSNDLENSENFANLVTNLEISMPKKFKNKKQTKQDILSPSFKVSRPSQTERDGQHKSADLHVYQVFTGFERDFDCLSDSSEIKRWKSDVKLLYKCRSEPSLASESGGPLENASRELGQAQLSVQQLQRLLDALELQQQVHHDTDVSLEGASPNVKKDRRKFGLRKKKSNSKCASVELSSQHIDPSTSHMALSALTAPPSPGGGASSMPNSAASLPIACAAARPQSLPGAEALATGNNVGPASLTSLTPDHQLREDFTVLAKDLVASLKTIVSTLVCERGRLRAAMEATDSTAAPPGAMVAALRTNLTSALQQNSELRSRLSRIHDASDLAEISSMGPNDPVVRQFQQSLSYSSSCVSASEFFDAEEHEDEAVKAEPIIQADEAGVIELDGDSSSEAGSLSSEEGSASSDNSDGAMPSVEQPTLRLNQNGLSDVAGGWSRRTRLPCTRPTPGGPSLWNLLYKNIGKDLSQVSMPVTINEPLNMLQRLCEELEYSELLDSAAECGSAIERMSLIAAFAVSAYAASAHRAASKPFNPLLAETYECVRDDKGFRFIAEQVSHHPPISACHAESTRWRFWQEARIKTKFWGKSMEFQPAGRVHVRLSTTGDHYSWNKVTTCVHNLFGGQRWVDQYGDMHITCHGTDLTCKLNFIKASSWSSTRHEVRGAVAGAGGARLRLQGRWSEALYAGDPPAARCLWRPGAMPPEHDLYYGFTRFAMELNEMEPGLRDVLPYTDTRLRPDQRALEEGDVDAAEQYKHQLEQSQRERRRDAANHQPAWFRKCSEGGEEVWVFTGEYWRARDDSFPGLRAPRIW